MSAPAKTAKKATKKAAKKAPAKKAPAKKAKKVKEPMTKDQLQAEEVALQKKYKKQDIVKNSIAEIGSSKDVQGRAVPTKFRGWNKRTVMIKCQWPGCKETRRIATSDLKQVRFCEEHTLEHRKNRRAELRKQKAKAKPKAK